MLKDLILRHSTHRFICKLVTILGGGVALVLVLVERVISTSGVYWTAAPLVLFWLLDAGYAAEQRRCADVLKKNPTREDPSALVWEGGDAALSRFFRSLISLSTWPFYLLLFGLIAGGGDQIARANRQAAIEIAAARPQPVTPLPSYYPPKNMPGNALRPNNGQMPFNPVNPSVNRFTPSPFPTPPRFTMPSRPPVTPVRFATPPPSPTNSPAPAVKNP